MKQNSAKLLFRVSLLAAQLGGLFVTSEVFARVGGGQSYGGGGVHGGGGGGGAIIWLLFQIVRMLVYLTIEYPAIGIPLDLIVIAAIISYFVRGQRRSSQAFSSVSIEASPTATAAGGRPEVIARGFDRLRKFDPNFSEIVFTDFCYALYAKAHDARGHGTTALDLFPPYLSESARKSLLQRNPPGTEEVKGIIIGSMRVAQIDGLETPVVRVALIFETNYTEVVKRGEGATDEMSYYVNERWELERKRDVLSPEPAQATALHCPRCGAPLQRDTIGACAFCGTKIDSGEFQWFVRNIALLSSEGRGPLLTSDVPEEGTDLPSVIQPTFASIRAEFERDNPEFSWGTFEARARLIFNELQAAWSTLNWERARPHETDNIFQMHQYWIEAYKKQGLRNALYQCQILSMQPVKIKEDAFYNSITMRIFAQGLDYTVDGQGRVVAGSNSLLRKWSEYWTFVRNRNAKSGSRTDLSCPNCGAGLKVNATGICEFCGGKVSSGQFDWVLSRIEQDESYSG